MTLSIDSLSSTYGHSPVFACSSRKKAGDIGEKFLIALKPDPNINPVSGDLDPITIAHAASRGAPLDFIVNIWEPYFEIRMPEDGDGGGEVVLLVTRYQIKALKG